MAQENKTVVSIILKAIDETKSGFTTPLRNISDIEKSLARIAPAAKFAAVAIAGAFAAMGKNFIDRADELSKLSQKAGVSTEFLSGLSHAAQLAGVETGQLGQSFKFLSAAIIEADTKGGETKALFDQLGISLRDSSGQLKSNERLFSEVAEAMSKFADGAGKSKAAVMLFGKAGADLIPLLNGGAEGLRKAHEEAEKFGLVISTKAGKDAEEFNDNLKRLKDAGLGMAGALVQEIMPALLKYSEAMVSASKETVNGSAAFEGMKTGLGFIVDLAGKAAFGINELAEAWGHLFRTAGAFSAGGYAAAGDEVNRYRASVEARSVALFSSAGTGVAGAKMTSAAQSKPDIGFVDDAAIKSDLAKRLAAEEKSNQEQIRFAEHRADVEKGIDDIRSDMALSQMTGLKKFMAESDLAYSKRLDQIGKLARSEDEFYELRSQAATEYHSVINARLQETADRLEAEEQAEYDLAVETFSKKKELRDQNTLEELAMVEQFAVLRNDQHAAIVARFDLEREMESQRYDEQLRQIAQLRLSEDQSLAMSFRAQEAYKRRVDALNIGQSNAKQRLWQQDAAVWSNILGQGAQLAQQFGKKGFIFYQALSIGQAHINTALAITRALAELGPIAGPIAAGVVAAMGAVQVGLIMAQKPPSAHGGLDFVPEQSTYILQRGERILAPNQNAEMMEMMRGMNRPQSSGEINLHIGGERIATLLYSMSRDGQLKLSQRALLAA